MGADEEYLMEYLMGSGVIQVGRFVAQGYFYDSRFTQWNSFERKKSREKKREERERNGEKKF